MPIKDSEIYPIGTVIRLKSGEFAIVRKYTFQNHNQNHLNYLIEIEGKKGLYCAFHDEIFLECSR